MDLTEIDRLREWLDLTNQQFDILHSIYQIESRNERSTPKNIQKEYSRLNQKSIERSNLFTILKYLMDRNVIVKSDHANYSLDLDGLVGVIDKKDSEFRDNYLKFKQARDDLNKYLNEVFQKPHKPTIKYLNHHELFSSLANNIKYAQEYCLSVRAPSLICSPAFYSLLDRKDYFDILRERSLVRRDLKVRWLTHLNFSIQFDRTLSLFKTIDAAYNEVLTQIEGVKDLVVNYPNLELNYIDHSLVLKSFIPITTRVYECYIYIPDGSNISNQGGLYIRSEDIAQEILRIFNIDCSSSIQLDSGNINKIIRKSKRELNNHINCFKKMEKNK